MRRLGPLLASFILTACVSIAPDHDQPRAFGFVWLVSKADLRSAIKASWYNTHRQLISSIDVVSRDTIYIHGISLLPYCTYDDIRRINGEWQSVGVRGIYVPAERNPAKRIGEPPK